MKFKLSTLGGLALAACLAACGGGGDESSGGTPGSGGGTETPPPPKIENNVAPSVTAISSPEVSVVRGVLRDESYSPVEEKAIEVGLDAQRRVVRLDIHRDAAANSPVTTSCHLSTLINVYSCAINQYSSKSIDVNFTLEAGSQPDTALLTQTEITTPHDGYPNTPALQAQTQTLFRWTDGQLREPLSAEWSVHTSLAATANFSSQESLVTTSKQFTTSKDAQNRTYSSGYTMQGSHISKVNDTVYRTAVVTRNYAVTGMNSGGWMSAAELNSSNTFQSGSASSNSTEQTAERYDYDNGKLTQASERKTTRYSSGGDSTWNFDATINRWGPAPNYSPLEYQTNTVQNISGSTYTTTNTMRFTSTDTQWIEEYEDTQTFNSNLSAVNHYKLILNTNQPVYTWNQAGQCQLADRSCPGYYAQGGLLRFYFDLPEGMLEVDF